MSDPFGPDWLRHVGEVLGGAGLLRAAQLLFRVPKGSIPVCETHVVREGRGLPWNEQIAVHPLPDGRITITPIRAKPPESDQR